MRIEITEEEISELGKLTKLAADSTESMTVNWEIISRFLAKLDRPFLPSRPEDFSPV